MCDPFLDMQELSIIVPVRLESSRFPHKPLFKIRGKPLILWTAERIVEQVPELPLYFAVEDPTVYKLLDSNGFQVILTKSSHPTGTDRIAEANETIGAEYVINVQGDEPLITGPQIRVLEELIRGPADMATLATRFGKEEDLRDPDKVKVVLDKESRALYFSRAPIPFARGHRGYVDARWLEGNECYWHLGVYAYTASFLKEYGTLPQGRLERVEMLEQLRALEHGYEIRVGICQERTIGIDSIGDAAEFEKILRASS